MPVPSGHTILTKVKHTLASKHKYKSTKGGMRKRSFSKEDRRVLKPGEEATITITLEIGIDEVMGYEPYIKDVDVSKGTATGVVRTTTGG